MDALCVRSARDEMRHIVGSSEPDVIIGSDNEQKRGCKKKDKDHMEFLCELYEAQAARGRSFVHELTSEVNSRMRCVAKIMAMPGTRVSSGWLRAMKEDQGLSTQANEPSLTRDKLECGCEANAQARIATLVLTRTTQSRKGEQTRTWVRQVARTMEEQLREDQGGLTRRSLSAGVIRRGGHCLNVWTKKLQVVSLSTAENE